MTATSTDLLLPDSGATRQHLDVLTRRWPELGEPCTIELVFLTADDVTAVKDVQHYTVHAAGLAGAAAHVAAMNRHGMDAYAVVDPVQLAAPRTMPCEETAAEGAGVPAAAQAAPLSIPNTRQRDAGGGR